jgi:hypothetical protein
MDATYKALPSLENRLRRVSGTSPGAEEFKSYPSCLLRQLVQKTPGVKKLKRKIPRKTINKYKDILIKH